MWAREQGVSYRTALNWFHGGTMPVPARQLPTGTILIDPPVRETGVTVAYCRVASHDQKPDLERQAGRVLTSASERGIVVLDDTEVAGDLVRDMTEVLTAMCARMYGRRSASWRAAAAVRAARAEPENQESSP